LLIIQCFVCTFAMKRILTIDFVCFVVWRLRGHCIRIQNPMQKQPKTYECATHTVFQLVVIVEIWEHCANEIHLLELCQVFFIML
jgi:hypothetical protein